MPAYAGHPVRRLACRRQRLIRQLLDPGHYPRDRTDMLVVLAMLRELQVVKPWRDVAVNHHALDDVAQGGYAFGERPEFGNRSDHRAAARVKFLNCFHVAPVSRDSG